MPTVDPWIYADVTFKRKRGETLPWDFTIMDGSVPKDLTGITVKLQCRGPVVPGVAPKDLPSRIVDGTVTFPSPGATAGKCRFSPTSLQMDLSSGVYLVQCDLEDGVGVKSKEPDGQAYWKLEVGDSL